MVADMPLVTIVTPAYNAADFLEETIQSVLGQNYPRLEYIVVNDGSKDGTGRILDRYSGRLTAVSQSNMGEAQTVNNAWRLAKGEIIGTVNADDPLLAGAVQDVVTFLAQRPDLIGTYPDWDVIDEASRVVAHYKVREFDYKLLLGRHACLPGPGVFFRRSVLDVVGGRNPEFRFTGDYEYWLRLGLVGKLARLPRTLATHRIHSQSATIRHASVEMAQEHVHVVETLYQRVDLPVEVRKIQPEALGWAHMVAGDVCQSGRLYVEGIKHYVRAAKLSNTCWRAGAGRIARSVLCGCGVYGILRWCWHRLRAPRSVREDLGATITIVHPRI